MALISKIRNNSWLLIVLIGLGLGGFLIMDMTSGQQSVFGSDVNTLATIEGEKVSISEFTQVEQILYGGGGGNTFSQRDYLWNYFMDKALMSQEANKIGLGVSSTELRELQFGQNISPIIEARFRNNQTFQIDRERLNSFRDAIDNGQFTDPNMRAYWAHQEKEIKVDRLKTKLGNLVAKAMYAPTWMAEMVSKEQAGKLDFAYVQVPFSEIENSEIALEDADFQNYLQKNSTSYEQKEETRKVDYVVFDVVPTQEDIDSIYASMERIAEEFEKVDNDTIFLENNYSNLDPTYFKKDALDPTIADTLFQLAVGSVYGPYEEDGVYRIAKVMNRKVVPDSVRSRHILIAAQDQASYIQAQRTIDSLKNLIETGVEPFDSLAAKFGSDGTRLKGGDLGYSAPDQMVKPFNDLIFFDGEPNELYTIATQFGVHLVEITGRKYETNEEGIQVGYIEEAIIPSEETQDRLYRDALKFAADHRKRDALLEAIEADNDLELQTSIGLKKNDYSIGDLGSVQSSRDIIKWAFSSSNYEGNVSADVYVYQDEVNFYNNKYAVVALKSIQAPGLPNVANIRDEIETQVINAKKAELVLENVSGKDMQGIASQYSSKIDTAANVTFSSGFIPGLGNEPKVVAKAFSLAQGETSSPIEGNNGVYVIKVLIKPEEVAATNLPQVRQTIDGNTKSQVANLLSKALQENAKVTDNRSRFY